MNFDANRITNEIHKKVTALVKQKSNSFEEAVSVLRALTIRTSKFRMQNELQRQLHHWLLG